MKRATFVTLLASCALLGASPARASIIFSDSFEVPDVSGTGFIFGNPPGWVLQTGPGGFVGISRPGVFYTGGNFNFLPPPAAGAQAAFLNFNKGDPATERLITAGPVGTTQAGYLYTFTAALGHHNNTDPGVLGLQILVGNSVVAASGPITGIPLGTFQEFSISYFATTTGAPIRLAITQSGILGGPNNFPNLNFVQASVDNVRLTAVPEPSSLAVLGLAAAVVFGCARRFRKDGPGSRGR